MNKYLVFLLWMSALGNILAQQAQDSIESGSVALTSGLSTGSFQRAMEPSRSYSIGFDTNGKTTIAQWKLEGRFAYQRQFKEDILFAGVLDPYDGNPFIWGDTLSGNWQHDGFDTRVDLALPRYKNNVFGITVDYTNATGARKNGPKPFYRYRDITIAPRVKTFIAGREDHYLSLKLSYASAFEENEMGYYSTNDTYLIRGRGYGSALKGPINSLDRRRKSNRYGIHLQWIYTDSWDIKVGSQYRKDNIQDGLSNPREDGNYMEFQGHGEINHAISNARYGLLLNYRAGSTDDAVFGFENSEAKEMSAVLSIDLDRKNNHQFLPEFLLGLFYHQQDDYIVYADYESQNLLMQLSRTHKINNIQFYWDIGYQYNINRQSSVLDPDVLSNLIYYPDFEYRTSDHLIVDMNPIIQWGANKNGKTNFFIKLKNRILARSTSSIRYIGEVTLGINL
ncbi:DUF6850 family outer membrane beta-barrel protein [Allomuricauda sp. F6463D]|uniref:DUF6850 family outer membrane beta-barrel protein n=1 Tax=Allomuricauda sp. F6463D TaxID=2926409 RepID=UPI001FF3E776|nr:DUF6850 family outer membrane beta-barrel protein [Muricauda sp. F6463D]MCK0159995.1 hypothetical protein [Muricauda sp. F6463D]